MAVKVRPQILEVGAILEAGVLGARGWQIDRRRKSCATTQPATKSLPIRSSCAPMINLCGVRRASGMWSRPENGKMTSSWAANMRAWPLRAMKAGSR